MALPNLSQISEALDKIMPELTPVPVGTVAYAHEVPTGWLQCNGATVSRTTYARLFKKIGTKYGAGDGSTTFNLPDLQHRVLEGTNTPSEVAQKVEAGLPDISGEIYPILSTNRTEVEEGALHFGERLVTSGTDGSSTINNYWRSIKFTASRNCSILGKSTTNQMASLRLIAIIKS